MPHLTFLYKTKQLHSSKLLTLFLLSLLFAFVFHGSYANPSLLTSFRLNLFAYSFIFLVCFKSFYKNIKAIENFITTDDGGDSFIFFYCTVTFAFSLTYLTIESDGVLFSILCWMGLFTIGFVNLIVPLCLFGESVSCAKRERERKIISYCENFEVYV